LAAKERESFARYHEMLAPGGPPRVSARVVALEAGEPAEFYGWELYDLVPGLNVYGRYRLNRDGTVDLVDDPGSTPRKFPRAVRPTDKPATPARKDPDE